MFQSQIVMLDLKISKKKSMEKGYFVLYSASVTRWLNIQRYFRQMFLSVEIATFDKEFWYIFLYLLIVKCWIFPNQLLENVLYKFQSSSDILREKCRPTHLFFLSYFKLRNLKHTNIIFKPKKRNFEWSQ